MVRPRSPTTPSKKLKNDKKCELPPTKGAENLKSSSCHDATQYRSPCHVGAGTEKCPFLREFNLKEADRTKLRNLLDCLNGEKSAASKKRTYIIIGKNGTGKTRLTKAMAEAILARSDKKTEIILATYECTSTPQHEIVIQLLPTDLEEKIRNTKDGRKTLVILDGIPCIEPPGVAYGPLHSQVLEAMGLNKLIEAVNSNKNAYLLVTSLRKLKLSGTKCHFDETITLNTPRGGD